MFNKKYSPLLQRPRIFISLLTALCWIAALANIFISLTDNAPLQSGNNVPAYSSHSPVTFTKNHQITPISNNTYEILLSDVPCSSISSECSKLLQDPSLQCIFSHSETSYNDYYFFSPVLDNMGFPCSSQGYNLHVAVTKSGHTYLGFPQITYDF